MAKVIKEFPSRTNNRPKYPWDQWLDGQIWELTPGEDFQATPPSFQAMVRKATTKRGLKVHLRLSDPERVILQAYKPEES